MKIYTRPYDPDMRMTRTTDVGIAREWKASGSIVTPDPDAATLHENGISDANGVTRVRFDSTRPIGEPVANTESAALTRHDKLRDLADKIDYEKLWQLPFMHRDKLTDDQRARLDAGVMLRRYADILQPDRWLVIPPTGSVQFSAGSLDKAYEMAKQGETRHTEAKS